MTPSAVISAPVPDPGYFPQIPEPSYPISMGLRKDFVKNPKCPSGTGGRWVLGSVKSAPYISSAKKTNKSKVHHPKFGSRTTELQSSTLSLAGRGQGSSQLTNQGFDLINPMNVPESENFHCSVTGMPSKGHELVVFRIPRPPVSLLERSDALLVKPSLTKPLKVAKAERFRRNANEPPGDSSARDRGWGSSIRTYPTDEVPETASLSEHTKRPIHFQETIL